MYNETVPVTAADASFLDDKTAETKRTNQGVSKPRSAGRCYAAADTYVNDVTNRKNYTILYAARHTANWDFLHQRPTNHRTRIVTPPPPQKKTPLL